MTAGWLPACLTRWMASLPIVTVAFFCERPRDGAADGEALFRDLALQNGDRGGAVVVIVEAGVVAGHPADEVELDVGVAVDERVDALLWVVSDEGLPDVGLGGPGFEGLGKPGGAHAETSLTAGTQV